MRKDRLISPLDSYIPKSENLSLTFNAANRGDKKRCRAKTPSTQRKTLCHFDQREKSFLDLSHSLGMTALGPSPWRPLRLCARHVFSDFFFIPKFQISLARF